MNKNHFVVVIGFGMFQVAASLAYGTALGSVSAGVGFISNFSFVVLVNCAALLASVVVFVIAKKSGLLSRSNLCFVSVCAMGGAFFASFSGGYAPIVSAGLSGLSLACQWVAWIELFSARGACGENVALEVCLGFTLGAVGIGIVSFIPFWFVKFVVLAGTIVSFGAHVALPSTRTAVRGFDSHDRRKSDRYPLISTFACFFILVCVIGALHTALIDSSSEHVLGYVPLWVSDLIPAVLMLLLALFAKDFLRPAYVYKVTFLVMMVVMSLLPLFSEQMRSLPGFLVSIGYSMCSIAFIIYIAQFSRAAGLGEYELPSVYMAGSCASLLVGFGFGAILNYIGNVTNLHLASLISLVSIYPLAVAFFFLVKRPDDASFWSSRWAADVAHEGSKDCEIDTLQQMAEKYSLTKREKEILSFLARGRSARVIAEDLVISENTVWFHIKKIYAKTGVHSKQDLIDLIERETP